MSSMYSPSGNFNSGNKKDNKNTIIILLLVLLVASWGYFLYSKNESNDLIAEKDQKYAALDSSKEEVQKEYDEAMLRLADLTTMNSGLDSLIRTRDKELSIIKDKFKALISKQNATRSDLEEAKKLVAELNGKISDYVREIERLQDENRQLTTDKNNLTTENKNLSNNLANTENARKEAENKVDVGSTLHASGFKIIAVNEKNSGKEKVTASAKRADKLRISFNLDENLIATTGTKQLYIIAKDPSGKIISEESLGSGRVGTRNDGQIEFTTQLTIEYKTGELKYVGFDLRQSDKYIKGNYSIIVYQNGFKIGEGVAVLK